MPKTLPILQLLQVSQNDLKPPQFDRKVFFTQRDVRENVFSHFFGKIRRHVGFNESWSNGVGRDVSSGPFSRRGFGKSNNACFCCAIIRLSDVSDKAHNGGNVDNSSFSFLGHCFRHCLILFKSRKK